MANVAVIYYSSTGNTYELAKAIAAGAEAAGATVRLHKVRELAPDEAIATNAGWVAHRQETQNLPEATLEDLEWADAYAFGTPTRYGTIQDICKVLTHWGAIVVPLGYTNPIVFDSANGNPYGATTVDPQGGDIPAQVLAAARWQGERLARVADALVAHRAAIAAPQTEAAIV